MARVIFLLWLLAIVLEFYFFTVASIIGDVPSGGHGDSQFVLGLLFALLAFLLGIAHGALRRLAQSKLFWLRLLMRAFLIPLVIAIAAFVGEPIILKVGRPIFCSEAFKQYYKSPATCWKCNPEANCGG